MAGRGRGNLINELLLQESTKIPENPSHSSKGEGIKIDDESTSRVRENDSAVLQRKSPSPLALLGRGVSESSTPSAGRGLMTPSQFTKPSLPGIRKPVQNKPSDLRLIEERPSSINTVDAQAKTQALKDAEQYLKTFCPDSIPEKKPVAQNVGLTHKNSYGLKTSGSAGCYTQPIKNQTVDSSQTGKTENEKAEAEWQRFKLQRQINRLLSKITKDDVDEVVMDLKLKLEESTLSEKFPQHSEWRVLLETLIDKSFESESFIEIASLIIKKIAENDIFKFETNFPAVVFTKITEVAKVTASDHVITNATKRFCKLLADMFLTSVQEDKRIHLVIFTCLKDCIEQWTYPDGVGDEVQGFQINKAETHAYAVKEIFDQISLGELGKEKTKELMPEMKRLLERVRESILNEGLPRDIREVYLDILLLNAKWIEVGDKTTETDSKKNIPSDLDSRNSESLSEVSLAEEMNEAVKEFAHVESMRSQNKLYSESQAEGNAADWDMLGGNVALTERNTEDFQSEADESQSASVIVEDEEICSEHIDYKSCSETSHETESVKGAQTADDDAVETYSDNLDEFTSEARDVTNRGNMSDGVNFEKQDPYHNVRIMVKNLKLDDQMQRFENNFIRDALLDADQDVLKGVLKEAGFPAGLIYEICVYLEKSKARTENSRKSPTDATTPIAHFSAPVFNFGQMQSEPGSATKGAEVSGPQSGMWRQRETAPKKKLLGIGRGGNLESGAQRTGVKIEDVNANRQTRGSDGNWGKPGFDRQRVQSEYSGGRNKDYAKNWRGPKGNNKASWNSSGFDRRRNGSPSHSPSKHFDETKQVGKVQPIRKRSNEEKKPATAVPLVFDGVPPGCLRCGEKDHLANGCKNSDVIFFGQ